MQQHAQLVLGCLSIGTLSTLALMDPASLLTQEAPSEVADSHDCQSVSVNRTAHSQ